MELTDEQVVVNVLNGTTDDYALLVRKYERLVYNLMYRYTGCAMESADLAQDIFLQSFARLHTLKSDKKYFNWLYTIALNKGRDWARTNGAGAARKQYTELNEYSCSAECNLQKASSQEQEIQHRQEQQRVENALMALSPNKREIVILRYRHERSIREIAEIFAITQSAVKMRISRSLKQLQDILSNTVDLE